MSVLNINDNWYSMIAMNDSILFLSMIVDCWWTCIDFLSDFSNNYEFEWESWIFHDYYDEISMILIIDY